MFGFVIKNEMFRKGGTSVNMILDSLLFIEKISLKHQIRNPHYFKFLLWVLKSQDNVLV